MGSLQRDNPMDWSLALCHLFVSSYLVHHKCWGTDVPWNGGTPLRAQQKILWRFQFRVILLWWLPTDDWSWRGLGLWPGSSTTAACITILALQNWLVPPTLCQSWLLLKVGLWHMWPSISKIHGILILQGTIQPSQNHCSEDHGLVCHKRKLGTKNYNVHILTLSALQL